MRNTLHQFRMKIRSFLRDYGKKFVLKHYAHRESVPGIWFTKWLVNIFCGFNFKKYQELMRKIPEEPVIMKDAKEFQGDIDVVIASVEKHGCMLKHASDLLKKRKRVVQIAVEKDLQAIMNIRNGLISQLKGSDAEVVATYVLKLVESSEWALQFADPSLKKDSDFIKNILSNSGVLPFDKNSDLKFSTSEIQRLLDLASVPKDTISSALSLDNRQRPSV